MKKLIKTVILIGLVLFSLKNLNQCSFKSIKNCSYMIGSEKILVINKHNKIDKKFVPNNLIEPSIPFNDGVENEEKLVEKEVAVSLEKLFKDAENTGIFLLGNSGYRSFELQDKTYKNRILSEGKDMADKYVAKPGQSEHQTGLAMDVTNKANYFTEDTKEAMWISENAHKYGFIIRYQKGKEYITGCNYEPWHLRYVGKKIATNMHENNLVLEEYIENEN